MLKLTSLPGLFSLIDRFDLPHKSSIRLCLRTRLSPSRSPSDNIPNSPMFPTATADDGRESCEYELAYVMVVSRFAWYASTSALGSKYRVCGVSSTSALVGISGGLSALASSATCPTTAVVDWLVPAVESVVTVAVAAPSEPASPSPYIELKVESRETTRECTPLLLRPRELARLRLRRGLLAGMGGLGREADNDCIPARDGGGSIVRPGSKRGR